MSFPTVRRMRMSTDADKAIIFTCTTRRSTHRTGSQATTTISGSDIERNDAVRPSKQTTDLIFSIYI